MVKVELSRKHLAPNLGASVIYVAQGEITWDGHDRAGTELRVRHYLFLVPFRIVVARVGQMKLLKGLQSVLSQGLWFFIKSALSPHLSGTKPLRYHTNTEE